MTRATLASTTRKHSNSINGPLNVDAPVPPRLRGSPFLAQAGVSSAPISKPSSSLSSSNPTPSDPSVVGSVVVDHDTNVDENGSTTIPHPGPWLDFAEFPVPQRPLSLNAAVSASTSLSHQQLLRSPMSVHYPAPPTSPTASYRPAPYSHSHPAASLAVSPPSSILRTHITTSRDSRATVKKLVRFTGSSVAATHDDNSDDEPSDREGDEDYDYFTLAPIPLSEPRGTTS